MLTSILTQQLPMLRQYEAFENGRYSALGQGPTERELTAVPNPHTSARRQTILDIEASLADASVVAYHCTRLAHDEMLAIRETGLHPLCTELVRGRLVARVAAGDFSSHEADELLRMCVHVVREDMRAGTIWAVLGRSALCDEHGMSNPLRFWGGEALLDQDRRHRLARIGKACIVETRVPVAHLRFPIARAFLQHYLFLNDAVAEDGAIDICVTSPITADRVSSIIEHGTAEFEHLTRCASWKVRLA